MTPSIVAFSKNGETLIGDLAKRQSVTNPERTVYSAKRFIGRKFLEVQSEIKTVPYKVVANNNGDAIFEVKISALCNQRVGVGCNIVHCLRISAGKDNQCR